MIEIVPYKTRWLEEFSILEADLDQAIGRYCVRFDHIGSTSVPGLAAKDIIDVMVTVNDLAVVEEMKAPLISLGFVFREGIQEDHVPPGYAPVPEEWQKRYFTRRGKGTPVHLHIRVSGRANHRFALLFRDYLRKVPIAAEAYARVKRQLARYVGQTDDHTAYVEIKDPVVDLVVIAAEDWADRTGWQLP